MEPSDRGREPIERLFDQLDLSRAPDLAALHAQHGNELAAALRAALETLDEQQRAMLGHGLVAGTTIDRIGELHGVPCAITVRWLTGARDALSNQLRREIAARLTLPLEELYAIVREVRSRIDIALLRIL
jgi:DNA-directed RNA polymerase specialized sigma24 family protein